MNPDRIQDIIGAVRGGRESQDTAESILRTLQRRAQQRGVVHADAVLREGDLRQELR